MQMKIKGEAYATFIKIDETICFLELRGRQIIPMLQILHQYPLMMKKMQCDKGGIKHILQGSNVMAPGLVSEGGYLEPGVLEGEAVAVMAEGKKHAMGIGFMMEGKGSDSLLKDPTGHAIEVALFLNDSVWRDISH